MNRNTVVVIIFLIVGENHQLRDVDKASERLVGHPLVDSVSFCKNPVVIIRFLDFNEGKRKPIHKTGYVGTETVTSVRIFTGEFRGNVPLVIVRILEIDKFKTTVGREYGVELFAQIIIPKHSDYLVQNQMASSLIQFGIQSPERAKKYVGQNVCVRIIIRYVIEIGVPQTT